jgi:hypothetical protein
MASALLVDAGERGCQLTDGSDITAPYSLLSCR